MFQTEVGKGPHNSDRHLDLNPLLDIDLDLPFNPELETRKNFTTKYDLDNVVG